ncbi:lachesin-like [Macrosteles quadrilineatus]|uniref:lachesin-like n=1 Tax=Macrosteles quadrilineatus TaxID=74068 RepID=UPI0023E26668|nr:lachesin-like [Macrosteles quadrilineatus]
MDQTIPLLVWYMVFVRSVSGQMPPKEVEPEFLAPLENLTVTQGREVTFTCVVNHLGAYKVAWIKSDSKAILAIHTHLVAHNTRLSVTHNGHNTWKLTVNNVQKNDSGTYMCQINTDPMRSQMGYLEVVIPPDILNEDGPDDYVAVEGGSVKVKCKATGVPDPTVLWRREDSQPIVLRADSTREKQVVRQFDGEELLLTNVHRADMGAYLCIASNGVPPSVSKRFIVQVLFPPMTKVSNQLVAAPAGSDVVLECYVETSPKAMHSWFKETGEKLMPSAKYSMEEYPINDYSLLMNITIRSLEKRDFGGYVCSSVSAMGKSEGLIRLQELNIPKTTVMPSPNYYEPVKPARKKPHKTHVKEKHQGSRKKNHNHHEEVEEEPRTTAEVRTESSLVSHPSRPPSWILHHNEVGPSSGAKRNVGVSVAVLTYSVTLYCQWLLHM